MTEDQKTSINTLKNNALIVERTLTEIESKVENKINVKVDYSNLLSAIDTLKINAVSFEDEILFEPVVIDTIQAYAQDHYQALYKYGPLKGQRIAKGPKDTLRLNVLDAPKPWNIFSDPKSFTFAPSLKGKEHTPAAWAVWPVWGPRNMPNWTTPRIVDGIFRQTYAAAGDDMLEVRKRMQTWDHQIVSGPRGVGTTSPYTTWRAHRRNASDVPGGKDNPNVMTTNPRVPIFTGITIDGAIAMLLPQGGVEYVAQLPREKSSIFYDILSWEEQRSVQWVPDAGTGKLWKVTHDTSVRKFNMEEYQVGMGNITSIDAIGRTLYMVRHSPLNSKVISYNPDTREEKEIVSLPWAWWVRHDSEGNLVIFDLQLWVHVINPSTGQLIRKWTPLSNPITDPLAHRLWVALDVDIYGACGPVDTVLTCSSHGSGNVDAYWSNKSGTPRSGLRGFGGRAPIGPGRFMGELTHYPWVVNFAADQAAMLFHGFAETNPTLMVHTPGVVYAPYDAGKAERGRQALIDGGHPDAAGLVPSFTCQVGLNGWSYNGLLTFEALADLEPQEVADFLRAGGIGSVPRAISTQLMQDMLFWIYYNSRQHVEQAHAGNAVNWLNRIYKVV